MQGKEEKSEYLIIRLHIFFDIISCNQSSI